MAEQQDGKDTDGTEETAKANSEGDGEDVSEEVAGSAADVDSASSGAGVQGPVPTVEDEVLDGPLNVGPGSVGYTLPILNDNPTDFWVAPAGERKTRWLVALGIVMIFLPNLGGFGLWDPWETHYGAVTTNMVETYDWISPWWGYKEKIGTEARQGNFFFSKPVLIFWTESLATNIFGRSEWSTRLPMAMLAMLAAFFSFLTLSRIWTRRVGVFGALVMATSPQFFMISRQAQTDMPFVGTMVISLCFLMLAFFGKARRHTDKSFWGWTGVALVALLLVTVPQYKLLITDLVTDVPANMQNPSFGWKLWNQGYWHAIIYGTVLAGVIVWFARALQRDIANRGLTDAVKDKWLRRWLMVGFYCVCALSFYAKGLLGFIPGAIILAYLIISNQWRILGRVELVRGILIFMCVSLPWYVAMFVKHGNAYYQRFFVHDHFNRLGAGVHQIDSGTFEHFIKWLGIGMFPWAIFVPFALIWMFRTNHRDKRAPNQGKMFVIAWFGVTFLLFTLSSTKFHHYIFPAMPALAILTALFLDKLADDKTWLPRLVTVVGVIFFASLTWDLHEDPQHVRNLMTYKYDRPMPQHLPIDPEAKVSNTPDTYTWEESTFWKHSTPLLKTILTTKAFKYEVWIPLVAVLGFLALGLFFVARTRRYGLAAMGLLSVLFAMWSLNYYMPTLSPHWSQKYLFDSYYDTCTLQQNPEEIEEAYEPILPKSWVGAFNKRVCQEDVISWLITWRGETYYSYNELQPITKEQPQFMPYLETRNHGEKFYALMERGKMSGFKSKLERYSDKLKRKSHPGWEGITGWDVKIENDESLYFQMVSATPKR